MAKNTLYEILEVSENASPEVIEKAYKILVKKYHPDLQPAEEKKHAEDKMKEINEAYEVLGDEQKRKAYDNELEAEREQLRREEELKKQSSSNIAYGPNNQTNQSYSQNYNRNNNVTNDQSYNNSNNTNFNYDKDRMEYEQRLRQEEAEQRMKMQENLNKEYTNAYNDYLRSLGFKVKERWTKEKTRDLFFVIIIIIVIIFLLWLFPPTRKWMINFYESNPIIKTVIDIIVSIITGIFTGIWDFITGLFN